MPAFSYALSRTLTPVTDKRWTSFFRGHPDSGELISLMNNSGLDGFNFYSLVVSLDSEPVVILPIFETHYGLASTLDQPLRGVLEKLEGVVPWLLKPKVLGVGFVEGEWGQFGINDAFDEATVHAAVTGGLQHVAEVARSLGCQIICLKDFTPETGKLLDESELEHYTQATSLPFCQIATNFNTLEEYFDHLPRKVRQDLRRKLRQSSQLRVEYTRNPEQWMDIIYELYESQARRSELSFGIHRRKYFADICSTVEGAQYALFFVDDQLVGFNLTIDRGDCLVDKYVGIDQEKGRANNVYFMAWLEKIKYCIEHKIPVCHLGAAAEGVKVRLGAYMIPSNVYFRHRNPLFNAVLKRLAPVLSYKPAVEPVEEPEQKTGVAVSEASIETVKQPRATCNARRRTPVRSL